MVIQYGRITDPAKRVRRIQGKRIKQVRTGQRLTIAAVAAAMNPPVTPGAISQWENGRTSPRQHHQIALARALNVEWSQLFSLDEAA